MAVQYSIDLKNARLAQIEVILGASPLLRVRSGAKPALITDASAGNVLAEAVLPADWLAAPANGQVSKSGAWADNSADIAGQAAHFELATSAGVVKIRGTITQTGGGGDMELDNINLAVAQAFSVTAFTIIHGN